MKSTSLHTLADLISVQLKNCPNKASIVDYHRNNKQSLSTLEVKRQIEAVATLFRNKFGVTSQDLVILSPNLSKGRWIISDLAIQQLGAVSVFIHHGLGKIKIQNIVLETNPKLLIYDDADSDLFGSFLIESSVKRLSLTKLFDSLKEEPRTDDEVQGNLPNPEDLSTIIYTSGSTADPKGVMLSHRNIVSNISDIAPLIPLDRRSRVISFLPFSHVFERTIILTYLSLGVSIYLPGERDAVIPVYTEAKPHLFTAVPRIIESMYDLVIKERDHKSLYSGFMIDWALKLGKELVNKKRPSLWQRVKMLIAKYVVLRKFRLKMGRQLKAIIVGAAYLHPKYSSIFEMSGIAIREGYGMTEASPVISVNRFQPGLHRRGTVGLPLHSVKVKIERAADTKDGEICVKGPNIMMGYFKDTESTKRVLTEDGWLRTGDLGRFTKDGFLVITDRLKNIFKTSSGKYVSPSSVEKILLKSDFIKQTIVEGFHRPYLTAIIYPDYNLLKRECEKRKIHWTSPKYMAYNLMVKEIIQESINSLTEELDSHEKVHDLILIESPFTVKNGMLAHNYKPKRNTILENFQKELDNIYGSS